MVELGELEFNQLICGGRVVTLPKYKFYTEVAEMLLDGARRWGGVSTKTISSLRQGVGEDLRFERKVSLEVQGGMVQFVALTIITWGFIYFTLVMTQIALPPLTLAVIVALQAGGVMVFTLLYHWRKRVNFSPFALHQLGLYRLTILAVSGVSVGEALAHSHLDQLIHTNGSRQISLDSLNGQLERMINGWRTSGRPILDQLALLIDELWFLLQMQGEHFVKEMQLIKFFTLALFYLSAYLMMVLALVEEMGAAL
jgi:hypothetical protein